MNNSVLPDESASESYTISVVIPVFNGANTISRCLSSVISQSLKPLEIIVVDDASTDRTIQEIDQVRLATSGIPIHVLRLSNNGGPSSARNFGIHHSQGTYIALLDADDYWLPHHLAVAVKVLRVEGSNVAISHEPLSHPQKDVSDVGIEIFYRRLQFASFLLFQKKYTTIALVASKDNIVRAGLFPVGRRYAEDLELFIKLYLCSEAWIVVDGPRSAVVGKHLYASGIGLSSNLMRMTCGTIASVFRALKDTKYRLYIPPLVFWCGLKFFRRLAITLAKRIDFFIGHLRSCVIK